MNWYNLLKNKCPKCNKELWFDANESMIMCHSLICGFMIESEKMTRICADMVSNKLRSEELKELLDE